MMPRLCGVTSRRSSSGVLSINAAAWIAAPRATTSSGCTPLHGSIVKNSATLRWTRGMRVMPPTSTTSSSSLLSRPALLRVRAQILIVSSIRSSVRSSSCWTVSFSCMWNTLPLGVVCKNGRSMTVSRTLESSQRAFSAASLSRCMAMRSSRIATPVSSSKVSIRYCMTRRSKFSPPRKVSPAVEMTSKTPWPMSRIETSKVPPPRS